MATKKTAAAEIETAKAVEEVKAEEVAEEVKAAPAAEKSEWDEEMEMIVPRKPKGDDPTYYVCINDRRFLIPADGKTQKLPKPVAIVLKESLEAEYAAEDFADHIINEG